MSPTPPHRFSRAATVLLVDDERHVTQGLSRLLRDSGLTVLVAHSAEEALGEMRRHSVDVVVSDERMPGMAGTELLSIVAREFPHTGRVVLTGQATIEAAMRAINESKVCRFLQKPCPPDAFRAAVEEALRAGAQAAMLSRLRDLARLDESTDGAGSNDAPRPPHPVPVAGFDVALMATLSTREREVFDMVATGLRIRQIAEALFISPHTARNHLKAIFAKLDVHSQTEVLDRSRGRGRASSR